MKIKIKGAYGATNFGDDLLMCLFEKYFLDDFEDAKVDFQGQYEVDYPKKILLKSSYNSNSFNEDWLVYGGGTQFFAFQNLPYKNSIERYKSIVKRIFKDPSYMFSKLTQKLYKNGSKMTFDDNVIHTRTAFLAFGLGPFYGNTRKIDEVKGILSKADYIGLRDIRSVKYCEEWGIKAYFGADIAYSSYYDYKVEKKSILAGKNKKKIGLIVRDWIWEESGNAYVDPIMDLYNHSNDDYEFQFIVFAPYKDPDWMKRLNGKDFLHWNPDNHSIEEFLGLLNEFDGFVSARFHGAIIGALLGKPVIAIEIEPKLRILSNDINELLLWEKPFKKSDLNDLLNSLDYDVDYSQSLTQLQQRADFGLSEFRKYFKSKI